MHKLFRTTLLLVAVLLIGQLAVGPVLGDDAEERKARILANLKLAYPQLEKMNIVMGELGPSAYEGLDEGSFSVNNRQSQSFFVTKDDKALYIISGNPVDVSRSTEEIAAEVAKREEEKAKEAEERIAEIDAALEDLPVRGNPEGKVTIVGFSDFQCPYCTRGANTVEQILEKYGDDVKFVFKHFPLGFHPWAKPAAIASHCAGQQDPEAFWTLHDQYFKNQKQINPTNVIAKSKEYLDGSGIDMDAWATCADDKNSEEYKAAAAVVDGDMEFGKKLGVTGTPGFFVNGQFLNGAQPLSAFEPLIAQAKANS